MRSLKWAAPALLASAALLLSACAGGGTTPTPAGPGMGGVAGAMHSASGKRLTVVGIHSDAKCNATNFPAGCFEFSVANGLSITWCYGPPSSPCEDTSEITDWSGNVYALKTGKQMKSIKVTWSGPFPCTASTCGTGSYELDSMAAGRKAPRQTKGFKDIQPIDGCLGTSCGELTAIGIGVGP